MAAQLGRFEGRTALITGAGTGIGRATALAFAREGAAVALAGLGTADLEEVRAEIEGAGGRAEVIETDVGDAVAVEAMVRGAVERFGRIDAAFNNAGISAIKPITEFEPAEYDEVMSVNARGVWLTLKHEIAAMRAAGVGGSIVNTSSVVTAGGMPGSSVYSASKGALDAMIRSLALEVGPAGIRINNVSPGFIRTAMTADTDGPFADLMARHAALRRLGEPDDVADVVVWLCSDGARFITGQTIAVDGGLAIPGFH